MAVAGIRLERTSAGVPRFATIDLRKHADFIPLLEKKGVEINNLRSAFSKVSTRKTGLDEALEDVKKGRVYSAKDAKSLIAQCLQ